MSTLFGWMFAAYSIYASLPGMVTSRDSFGAGDPVTLELSVDSGTGSLGEPVVLNYRVMNRTGGAVTLDWRQETISYGNTEPPRLPPWLSISVNNPRGEPVRLDFPKVQKYFGEHASARPQATSTKEIIREGAIVLSQWFHPRSPGEYKIRIVPNLGYTLGDGSTGIIDNQRMLDITVGITSQRKLQACATTMLQQILTESRPERLRTLVIALVHMPDAVSGVLRSLLQDRRFHDREFAIWQLRWKGTKQSVTLAQEFSPQYHPGVRVEVENKGNGTP